MELIFLICHCYWQYARSSIDLTKCSVCNERMTYFTHSVWFVVEMHFCDLCHKVPDMTIP